MALINHAGSRSGLRPAGRITDKWSQNSLLAGQFVTLADREQTLSAGVVHGTSSDRSQPAMEGVHSRTPDGAVLWNLAAHNSAQLRLERITDAGDGSFLWTILERNDPAPDGAVHGAVLALSADCALVLDGAGDRFTRARIFRHAGGGLGKVAEGVCAQLPARADWPLLPAGENGFFYLSRDRVLVRGTVSGSSIGFSVADGSFFRNGATLYYTEEAGYNRMYGIPLAQGGHLVCWNRVTQILDSGEEVEQDPDLGTLYWPYETYTYDLLLTRLDSGGVPLETVTLRAGVTGSRATAFACPTRLPLQLADGRVLLWCNKENGHPGEGAAAWLVTVGETLSLEEAPEPLRSRSSLEKLADIGTDSLLAAVTAWGDSGIRSADRFRPQLTYYRLSGSSLTELYRADAQGPTQAAGYSGSFYWTGHWSAAGRTLVFGGRWSPRPEYLARLTARWTSGFRTGAAGELYSGLCGRSSGPEGTFGLLAPVN